MKLTTRSFLMFGASLALLGMSLPLYAASDNSVTELPAEGNSQCKDYALNGLVLQMRTTKPVLDPLVGMLEGPDGPADPDEDDESASYSIIPTDLAAFVSFESTTPIDFAILKRKRGNEVRLFYYPSGGVTNDANMRLPSGGPIGVISLCYGIGNEPPPPTPPGSFPICGGIDDVGVNCPTDGSSSLVCNFELEDPNGDKKDFFGLDDDNCCTCNTQSLTECDPNLVADPITGALPEGACPGSNLTEVPSGITGTRDPGTFFCITTGGSRRCYTR